MASRGFFILLSVLLSGCAVSQLQILNDQQITENCETLPVKIRWVGPKESVDKAKIARTVKGYKVYIKPQSDDVFREFVDAGLANQYTFNNLAPGKKYNLKVVAYNAAGEGEATPEVSKAVCSSAKK